MCVCPCVNKQDEELKPVKQLHWAKGLFITISLSTPLTLSLKGHALNTVYSSTQNAWEAKEAWGKKSCSREQAVHPRLILHSLGKQATVLLKRPEFTELCFWKVFATHLSITGLPPSCDAGEGNGNLGIWWERSQYVCNCRKPTTEVSKHHGRRMRCNPQRCFRIAPYLKPSRNYVQQFKSIENWEYFWALCLVLCLHYKCHFSCPKDISGCRGWKREVLSAQTSLCGASSSLKHMDLKWKNTHMLVSTCWCAHGAYQAHVLQNPLYACLQMQSGTNHSLPKAAHTVSHMLNLTQGHDGAAQELLTIIIIFIARVQLSQL